MYELIAIINGVVIGTSRALNGRLSSEKGPLQSSIWNHAVGFLFLTALLLVLGGWGFTKVDGLPFFAYLGGVFGAMYVAIQSAAFTRLGATNTTIAVISGQMFSGVLLDYWHGNAASSPQLAGVALLLMGIHLTRR
jgi:bacterial/archaeal transporter family-2 protein